MPATYVPSEDVALLLPQDAVTAYLQFREMSVEALRQDVGNEYWITRGWFFSAVEAWSKQEAISNDINNKLTRLGKFLGLLENPAFVSGELNFLAWFPSRVECQLLADYCFVPEPQLRIMLGLGDAGSLKRAIARRSGLSAELVTYIEETTNPWVSVALRVSKSVPDERKVLWALSSEPAKDSGALRDKLPTDVSAETLISEWVSMKPFYGWRVKDMEPIANGWTIIKVGVTE